MNIQYLRASSINTYSGCQFQFFLETILEIPSISGKKALLGTIVHHVLELMAKASKSENKTGLRVEHIKLLDFCWNRYKKENLGKIELNDKKDKKFCLESIEKILCSSYNPLNLKVLATEKQFKIPILSEGFKFDYYDLVKKTNISGNYEMRGTMDLITEVDKDTIELIDWKTGSRKCWNTGVEKDYDYLSSKDIQLRMYDLATSILYPQYKNILLTIHFVNDGGPFTVCFDQDQRKETLEIIRSNFNAIKGNSLPDRIKETNSANLWKCRSVCFYGKTKTENGCNICDNVHNYMLANGTDKTIERITAVKAAKNSVVKAQTSDRRNVFKDEA